MSDSRTGAQGWKICHLEWFINSKCDYTCRRCVPETAPSDKPDIGVDACIEALTSFAEFASAQKCEAHITFYPRQATPCEPFISVLNAVRRLKTEGRLKKIACANRGDLPGDKIRLYHDGGVDVCHLTIDGPAPVQDELRRDGSHRDTIKAFREARASGMTVAPLMILVAHNAPHIAATMRLMLDEGFDSFALKAGIAGDITGRNAKSTAHPDPGSLWNKLLSPAGWRAVLLDALGFLDSAAVVSPEFRNRFILSEPMYARLFLELGRMKEYRQLARNGDIDGTLQFTLKPDGTVHSHSWAPAIGSFPGGSFQQMYATSHPLRWFEGPEDMAEYAAGKQKEFSKCAVCAAAGFCKPTLVGAQNQRLFYHPDVRCWVDKQGEGSNDRRS